MRASATPSPPPSGKSSRPEALRKLETLRPRPLRRSRASTTIRGSIPSACSASTRNLAFPPSRNCAKSSTAARSREALGLRMAQHVRQGLTETHAMLLYRADDLRAAVEEFLLGPCRATRAEVVGEVRRRTEVIEELAFVIETDDFPRGHRAPAALRRAHALGLLRERQCGVCAFFRRPAAYSARRQEGLGPADGRLHGLEGAPQKTDGRDRLPYAN